MTSTLDVRRLGKEHAPWELSIVRQDSSFCYGGFRPYFYLIVHRSVRRPLIMQVLSEKFIDVAKIVSSRYRKILPREELEEIEREPYMVEETDMRAWVYHQTGPSPAAGKYVRDPDFTVLKVRTWVPWAVRKVGSTFVGSRTCRPSAMNILYVARFVLDNYEYRPLDIVPIYYDLDTEILDKLRRVRYVVYDLEVLKDGTRVLSLLEVDLLDESMDVDTARERIRTFIYRKPDDPDAEEARKILERARVLVGYNVLHYDNKVLARDRIFCEGYNYSKCIVDLCELLKVQAQAAGIGTASQALQDVMYALRDRLGVPGHMIGKMIETKMRGAQLLTRLDTAVEYNINDVIVTWRLAELFLPYVFGIAGLVQVPPSAVLRLRPGQLFEYTLVHWFEIHGEVIEARPVFTSEAERLLLKGEKVFTFEDIAEFWSAYRERLESLMRQTSDIAVIVHELRKIADEILKKMIKPRALKKRRSGTERVESLIIGKIVHVDVEMMYPTKIMNAHIDPTCWVGGVAEDAVFAADRYESPFYALVMRLYWARADIKQRKKEVERQLEKLRQEGRLDQETERKLRTLKSLYSLLSDLVKPIINSAYGALSKSRGPTHGGHLQVALKIFHDTIRDLVTLLLYAKLRGWEPLYGDTDSLFVKVGSGDDPARVVAELNKVADLLGYRLSHEGTYDYMYIFAKKSYAVGEKGRYCKLKGQFIGRVKHFTSAYVRGLLMDALAKGTVSELVQKIKETNDVLLLLPSLSKSFADLVLKSTEDIKRVEQDKLRNYARVVIGKGGNVKIGYLKSLRPASVNLARLAALALSYGRKIITVRCPTCGSRIATLVRPGTGTVRCRCGKRINIHDIVDSYYIVDYLAIDDVDDLADLRALLLVEGDRLGGRHAIVAVEQGGEWRVYLTTVERDDCHYVLVDPRAPPDKLREELRKIYLGDSPRLETVVEVPLDYSRWRGKSELVRKVWRLAGIKLRVRILRELTIDEVKSYVMKTLKKYLEWSGLYRLINDYYLLDQDTRQISITLFMD